MLLHVFRHVEAQKLDAEVVGELLGHFGLADAGGAREQVVADRLLRLAQARARQLDRRRQRLDRLLLAEDHAFQPGFEVAQGFGIVLGHVFRRDPGDLGDNRLDVLHADRFLALRSGQQVLRRTRLVDHVDGAVGQLAVVDVAARQLHRRLDRLGGVLDVVMVLEIRLQPAQDLHRIVDRRLVDVDLLEPAAERAVLLEMLAVFLVGGRAHAAQLAALQRRLEQVGGVHRAAGRGAGADHRMDLVDEQHRIGMRFELVDHGLQPLLEIAAIAGTRQQRAHVERIDRGLGQHLGHLVADDLPRQPLGDGGLADARVADQQRVVLAPAAQHLDAALDLVVAPDQRIDVALSRLGVEIDAVFRKRGVALRIAIVVRISGLVVELRRAGHLPRFAVGRILGNTVGDEIDRVVAGHVLFLQEIGGIRFALGEDRDKHVGAGHLGAARALHVNRGALDHPLEGGGGHGFGALDIGFERGEVFVDVLDQRPAQLFEVDAAGFHHPGRVRLIDQREQQVLERGELVAALVGLGQGGVDGLF